MQTWWLGAGHHWGSRDLQAGMYVQPKCPGAGQHGVTVPISSRTPGAGLPRMNSWPTKGERDAAAQPHTRCCAYLGVI